MEGNAMRQIVRWLLSAGFLLAICASGGTPAMSAGSAGAVAPGTARMAERLRAILAAGNPASNPILNAERAELLKAKIGREPDRGKQLSLTVDFAVELVQAGKTNEGLEQLALAREGAKGLEEGAPRDRLLTRIGEAFGISYLRLAEQENCIGAHTSASCLLPIKSGGVHTRQRGSRLAIEEYRALLEKDPENLEYRWLLNLASMTLGEYPGKVPERWRIPPASFASEVNLKAFTDIAPLLGLDVVGAAGGVVADDWNGDGYLDLMVSSWGLPDQLRFFRNNGDGTFTERTAEAGILGETGGLNLIQADYNNDGSPDLLVLRGAWLGFSDAGKQPRSLLRNNGDGTFTDVTEEAGLLSLEPSQTASWGDFDNDGYLDLFVGNESVGTNKYPCRLYHNNGDGTFTEMAAATGVDNVGFVKGVAWGDFNNDGRLDLYLSRFGQPNVLYRNDGPVTEASADDGKGPAEGKRAPVRWKFTDVTREAGVAEPLRSFTTWFFDYDNDGWLDLLVSPFLGFSGKNLADVAAEYLGLPSKAETPRLYHNNHDGTFTDVTRQVHLDHPLLTMGANFGDIDNDGYPDIYWGTGEPNLSTLIPNRMFRNDRGLRFQDVTSTTGLGHLQKGHGIAFADFDNNGSQDIFAVLGGAYQGDVYQRSLFLNPGNGNRWITLKLEGVESNRSGIGARIKVTVDEGGAERSIHALVSSGGSFGGSPLQQHIGLGAARSIRSIEVTWPLGRKQTFTGAGLDRFYRVREGDAALREIDLKKLDFFAHGNPSQHQHGGK
jgi:ASPIC/UnbV protein/VCBS repeat protein